MDEVDDLVVTPFKEIVDKAKTAVENAGDSNPSMLKAAQTLLKEGERGLKRIEPLCKKHLDDYGFNFVAALKDHDEIAKYRSDLNELLWEFDDYIFPEDFDAEKFAELQSLSRKAAPKIYDILMRMKLESPLSDAASSRGSVPQLLTPTSPPMQGRFLSTSASDFHKGSTGSSLADIHDATAQLRGMMCSPSTTDSSHDHMREPPRPPSMNPWDWEVKPAPPSDSRTPEEVDFDRRAVETESPVLPAASLSGDSHPRLAVAHPPPSSVASGQSDYGGHDEERRLSATSQNTASDRGGYNHHHYNAPSRPRQVTLSQFSIPENEVSEQHGAIPFFKPAATPYSPTQSQHSRQASIPMSVNSDTLSETTHTDLASPSSHDSRGQYGSLGATGFSPVRPPPPPPVQPAPDAASASVLAQMDAGPIPVESEDASKPARPATNQAEECKIGDDSSFHLGKGFCEGAQDVLRGGIGVKRTKKQGFVTQSTIARCLGCLYELDFAQIENDVSRHDKGNYSKAIGINFRLRFLQKSHIAAKRVDDVQYGCVFCVQQGFTLDKSDATVFFNQKALFDHLARHPRPLPEVPGLTVIEGERVPDRHHNDYDIHFKRQPLPHPVFERANEIAPLPCGIAKEQARRLYGQRLLYDRSPALELAQGARITGISWPVQYQGEWMLGWHNGNYASIPSDIVKLEVPARSEIKYDRTSLVRAKARWKFHMKEKDKDKNEWLKFDKNETISNIAWVDAECWCWTGTNAKGKSGIFPHQYLDTESVHQQSPSSARAGSLYEEKVRSSSSMIPKFSIRKNSGRPASITSSLNSR